MSTYTQRYEQLKAKATRRVTCPGCGKKRRVSRTFTQTVNPYNPVVKALSEGSLYVEAWYAVRQSVAAEAKAWQPDDDESRHIACEERGES